MERCLWKVSGDDVQKTFFGVSLYNKGLYVVLKPPSYLTLDSSTRYYAFLHLYSHRPIT
jgi:hypothetical protein